MRYASSARSIWSGCAPRFRGRLAATAQITFSLDPIHYLSPLLAMRVGRRSGRRLLRNRAEDALPDSCLRTRFAHPRHNVAQLGCQSSFETPGHLALHSLLESCFPLDRLRDLRQVRGRSRECKSPCSPRIDRCYANGLIGLAASGVLAGFLSVCSAGRRAGSVCLGCPLERPKNLLAFPLLLASICGAMQSPVSLLVAPGLRRLGASDRLCASIPPARCDVYRTVRIAPRVVISSSAEIMWNLLACQVALACHSAAHASRTASFFVTPVNLSLET